MTLYNELCSFFSHIYPHSTVDNLPLYASSWNCTDQKIKILVLSLLEHSLKIHNSLKLSPKIKSFKIIQSRNSDFPQEKYAITFFDPFDIKIANKCLIDWKECSFLFSKKLFTEKNWKIVSAEKNLKKLEIANAIFLEGLRDYLSIFSNKVTVSEKQENDLQIIYLEGCEKDLKEFFTNLSYDSSKEPYFMDYGKILYM